MTHVNNQVFLHFIPQDHSIADKIKERLQAEHISCFMLPEVENLDSHFKVLHALEDIIASGGAVVLVVTAESLKSNWLIANAQYSCELAGRRTVLVIYQVGQVPEQNPLALYYAQAAVVHAGADPQRTLYKLVNHVKRVLARPDAPQALRPQRMPRRLLKRLAIGAAVLAVVLGSGNYFIPRILQMRQQLPQIIATPVVFEQPFQGQSLDQGILSDRRFVPPAMPAADPQQEAPFYFEPQFIHKRISASDPAFENVNLLDNGRSVGFITSQDQYILRQSNGQLQFAVAPQYNDGADDPGIMLGEPFAHLIHTDSFEYFGLRFRLADYTGWSDADQELSAGLGLWYLENYVGLAHFDLRSQTLHLHAAETGINNLLGSDWHTLEFLPDVKTGRLNVYLDGELAGQTEELPQADAWAQIVFSMNIQATDEWLNLYIHEVVFGGSQPLLVADEPQQAQFALQPDEVLFQTGFDGALPEDVFVEGGLTFPIANGVFRFEINSRNPNHSTVINVPAQPADRMNYYALRYRILDEEPDYWSTWGHIGIKSYSPDMERDLRYNIGVEASRYGAEFTYFAGQNRINQMWGSPENFQKGGWHTMEMVFQPITPDGSRLRLLYWQDGRFIGGDEMEPSRYFIEGANPFWMKFETYAGQHRRQTHRGEFDEIIMGYIDLAGQQ